MGFWCRRCGGRILEDEPYKDGHGQWMMVLTCLLCARESQCPMKEYKAYIKKLEKIVTEKSKSSKKQVLPV